MRGFCAMKKISPNYATGDALVRWIRERHDFALQKLAKSGLSLQPRTRSTCTMATPRSSRSSSSSTPAQSRASTSSQKRAGSPEKKPPRSKQVRHRPRTSSIYARSLIALARRIANIKRKLLNDAPSHEILDDFFERVTVEPAFTFDFRHGPPWLREAIARACEDLLDKPTGESTVFLFSVPEHELVHGSVVIGGYMGTALFFEDIRLGAIGLYPADESRGAFFARLVIMDEPEADPESLN
jgi:hypothetical protein